MRTDELDFDLPPELIAQFPSPTRSASRLLHYRRSSREIAHTRFSELASLLRAGDLLVFNDARVLPARFTLQKPTGGLVEGLFLSEESPGVWRVLLKNLGSAGASPSPAGSPSPRASSPPSDKPLCFLDAPETAARVIRRGEAGECDLAIAPAEPALQLLARVGRMPLPPYIKRQKHHDERDDADRERYQTVYAQNPGAVAAPTAGLHFDEALLGALAAAGIVRTFVTLYVGLGTFRPVTAERLEDHAMHAEGYRIDPPAAEAINAAKRDGRRVIAVGTTAARVLESQPAGAPIRPVEAQTSIFIHPPYSWRHVDALITNFHLPRSTLIALVAAMTGLDEQRRIYQAAITERYRFFSYGDAMLIE